MNAKFKIAQFVILLSLACIFFFSCGYTKEDAKKYLPGEYFYEIPSGELQELKINPDFTLHQIIYSKNKREILYENSGEMHVSGRKIEFEHWLECYKLAEQKMIAKPYITSSIGIYWRKPQGNEGVLIIMFDESNYIFRKR
ncbi:MAG: hypothetical protein IT249_18860 [Chitinophagaceae bacterium]|nr:hypothetical protein [Chitinophagaceae bacterium]